MARKVLYQTVKDKGNPKEIKENGPILCSNDDAWLGHGYYFWDTFEDLGHWWGQYKLRVPYMLWKALCDFDTKSCLDLHGEPEHLALFISMIKLVKDQNIEDDPENTTVSDVLYYIRNVVGINHFTSVRVSGELSIGAKNLTYNLKLPFEIGKNQFLNLLPPIQLCIYDLEAMNFREHDLIYPDHYMDAV